MSYEQNSEKKLGRGLSALIGDNKNKTQITQNLANKNQKLVEMIPLSQIKAGIYQPREIFNDQEISDLAESIKSNGVIQPIILRKINDENEYEIIAGERRFRAANLAKMTEIPAIVKKINNHEALEMALIENIQRQDLTAIEEAKGYQRLIKEFAYNQEEVGKKVGKSRSHINNLLRLLNLPKKVQEMIDFGAISMGHARAIINFPNSEELAEKIIAENLSVRDIENLTRNQKVEQINKKDVVTNNSKNIPLIVRSGKKVKFFNSDLLTKMEKELAKFSQAKAKIVYNPLKNKGTITIKFDDISKIENFINKLGS